MNTIIFTLGWIAFVSIAIAISGFVFWGIYMVLYSEYLYYNELRYFKKKLQKKDKDAIILVLRYIERLCYGHSKEVSREWNVEDWIKYFEEKTK